MDQLQSSNRSGFSLIELLIVVTLTVMLLLTASVLFMTFLVGGSKVNNTQLVKQEGQYAISQMEFLLRNAVELLPNDSGNECVTDMSQIKFKSIDGGITKLFTQEDGGVNKIASNSGIYLTSGAVDLATEPDFDCYQPNDEAHPHINITFTLRKGTPGTNLDRDIVEETFTTSTTIRSL